jgi:citrate synthase
LLQAALVLIADHELPVSTVAVRLAASTGAHVYAVVSAGLGALDGPRHGGASLGAENLIAEVAGGKDAARAIGERLRRGERIPGFGQRLYPGGDPRATVLLRLLAATAGERALGPVRRLGAVMQARGLPGANVDLAMGTLAQRLRMITGAGEVIFAVGRTAGWIAHALEEYAAPTTYRPRAVYTGPTVVGAAPRG